MEKLDEIFKEFLVESYESLDQLDQDLMSLEDAPDDLDRLASIFRSVHTIKGTSGFLSLPKLERVTHVGESLLVPLRDGEMRLTREIADGLLAMLDSVRQILGNIEQSGTEGDDDHADVVSMLEQLRLSEGQSAQPTDTSKNETAKDEEPTADSTGQDAPADSNESETQDTASAPSSDDSPTAATPPVDANPAPTAPPETDAPLSPASQGGGETSASRSNSIADTTVRLDVELLDRLMNLVGELVLARNQIMRFGEISEDSTMVAACQRLNLITSELQEGVMKTRMQPIRIAWSKIPRVVRDLSNSCGKQVQVRMKGEGTELDKTILEAIKDPLTHIVRNSVDHGIESPEVRKAAGKPAEGTLRLESYHEGGQVIIEIGDDGGGIDVERVKAKALAKGLVNPERIATMNDRELTNLILLPGFSTAEKVTNVSGRGVGMDVVKTNVEKIGGTLDIQSVKGQGTTLRIKIPLTLAIVPALIVACKEELFAIPQVSLLELVRLDGQRAKEEIELIHDVPVYRLREHLLPLLYLDEELELRPRRGARDHGESEVVNIVVLQSDGRQFGLVVDQINDTQEIVVKPLSQHLKGISTYAGATIMGDGSVSLILDVHGLAAQGNVITEHSDATVEAARLLTGEHSGERTSWLVVDAGYDTRAAIRLDTVARLEEFSPENIEHGATGQVVQYRGQIMPLVPLNGSFDAGTEAETLQVVVYNCGTKSVGVVVGKIIDVVDEVLAEDQENNTQIIAGRVTQVVDLDSFVRESVPGLPYGTLSA